MPKRSILAFTLSVLLLAVCQPSAAQISCERLESDLSFLADDLCLGRESGTAGIEAARRYIVNRFRNSGLSPVDWQFTQSFRKEGRIYRNVVGIVRSTKPTDKCIVICAHYDHLGQINGTIYNGADDNASGVAALLGIADAFSAKKHSGIPIPCNIVFVAFDGKEKDMCGSLQFIKSSGFDPKKIVCAINMDILGTDLVPPGHNRNYLIALGENTLPPVSRGVLSSLCSRREYGLDLWLSFYGSRDFSRIMYGAGDHASFAERNIPSVFFTSGFHELTYKAGDDTSIINFGLLRKRALVIYEFAEYLLRNP